MSQKEYKVITLFPETIQAYMDASMMGRAQAREIFSLDLVQLRDYAINDYGQVDDKVYGGGRGMLLMAEPIHRAWQACQAERERPLRTIYCSPRGRRFDQQLAHDLAAEEGLVILCGHYEGVDERVLEACQAEEISLGDFVLSGGEICAMAILDAVLRLIPGVLPDPEAWQEESFSDSLLAESQYSRPQTWEGLSVPPVLLSGNEREIQAFRRQSQLLQTYQKRPDLLAKSELDKRDWELLLKALAELDK